MEDANARPQTPSSETAPEGTQPSLISIDQFAAVELRTGRIVEAGLHPAADRLLILQVDLGEAAPRQIVAGIRADWEPEQLVGRVVIIAANLKPARLRGQESQGMLLAVRGTEKVLPLTVDGPVTPGTRVT